MLRIPLLLFFIFLVKISLAQVTFSVELGKDSMQIGDINVYRMKVTLPADVTIRSIDLKSLATNPLSKERFYQDTSFTNDPAKMAQLDEYFRQQGFSKEVMEIQKYGNWEAPGKAMMLAGSEANWTTQNNGNQVLKENDIQFTFWEEGIHKILAPTIEYEKNGALRTVTANDIQVLVGSPLSRETSPIDSLTVQPIKNVIEEPLDWVQDVLIPLGLFLLGCALLAGLIYYFIKKKSAPQKEIPQPKEYIPASVIAMNQLQKLKEEKLWQNGKIKEYQSRLTHTIREYLENRYQIHALENTTHQIGLDLKSLNLNEGIRMDLQNILQVADLVKFAKAEPGADVHEQFMTKAINFVEATRKSTAQIEAEKAAIEAEYVKALEDAKLKK